MKRIAEVYNTQVHILSYLRNCIRIRRCFLRINTKLRPYLLKSLPLIPDQVLLGGVHKAVWIRPTVPVWFCMVKSRYKPYQFCFVLFGEKSIQLQNHECVSFVCHGSRDTSGNVICNFKWNCLMDRPRVDNNIFYCNQGKTKQKGIG